MKDQESQSQIAEQRMIPRMSMRQSQKQKQAYVTFQDAKEMDEQMQNSSKDHTECTCQNISWNSLKGQKEDSLTQAGIKVYHSKLWMIQKTLFTCCKQMDMQMKVLVKRNSVFEICRVRGTPDNEEGIKYKLEGYGMTVKLSVIVVREGKEFYWKEIQLPENTLTQDIEHNISISEKPNSTVQIVFNQFNFSFNLATPWFAEEKICFKGSFQIKNLQIQTSDYISFENEETQCKLVSCRLF